jgi:glycosyltransferase involved in cell wall biosynthesis
MVTTVENGVSGYVDTNVDTLVGAMRELLTFPEEARRLGDNARAYARERFSIDRFRRDWDAVLYDVAGARQRVRVSLSS